MGMDQFFTREKSNSGVVFYIDNLDGTKSDYWLKIAGADSDIFRSKESELKRKIIESKSQGSDIDSDSVVEDSTAELAASLILEWNFEEELTIENAKRLVVEAPQIMDDINQLVSNRAKYFAKKSEA